jgi:hypothetical protein
MTPFAYWVQPARIGLYGTELIKTHPCAIRRCERVQLHADEDKAACLSRLKTECFSPEKSPLDSSLFHRTE